jgi:hypothetical protein
VSEIKLRDEVKILGGFEDGNLGTVVNIYTEEDSTPRYDVRVVNVEGKNVVLPAFRAHRLEKIELVALSEDGHDVREGDLVFNYYDGEWGKVTDMHDTFDALRHHADYPEREVIDRNQDIWFKVNGTGLNGQRIATHDPSGRHPKPKVEA